MESQEVRFNIHVERVDESRTGVAWWADSEDLPGYFATAETMTELRERLEEGLVFEGRADCRVVERLVGHVPDSAIAVLV